MSSLPLPQLAAAPWTATCAAAAAPRRGRGCGQVAAVWSRAAWSAAPCGTGVTNDSHTSWSMMGGPAWSAGPYGAEVTHGSPASRRWSRGAGLATACAGVGTFCPIDQVANGCTGMVSSAMWHRIEGKRLAALHFEAQIKPAAACYTHEAFCGITLHGHGSKHSNWGFGITLYGHSSKHSNWGFGITLYGHSSKQSNWGFGITLYGHSSKHSHKGST